MRVTHRMLVHSVARNIRENLRSLEEKSACLSRGRYFDRPSQDPVGTYKVMRITGTGLLRNEQYRRNIGEGITWLTVTEEALAEAIEVVQRLRELAVYTASGALTPQDRQMIAPEAEQLLRHLVMLGNSEVNGLYIFGGHKTQDPPYTFEGEIIAYTGDEGQRAVEITPEQTIAVNLNGAEVFGNGAEGLLQSVRKMRSALLADDVQALGGEILQELNAHLDSLLQCRAEIGARMARLSSVEERLNGEHIHLRELRSKIEDIDVAEVITEFMMQENAYKTALATGARMIFPSLVDFLR